MPIELNYYNILGHEGMLKDSVRCEAFRPAIEEAVTLRDGGVEAPILLLQGVLKPGSSNWPRSAIFG